MYAVFRLQLQTTVLEMLWVDGESSGAERKFSRSLFYQNMVCYCDSMVCGTLCHIGERNESVVILLSQ